MSRKHRYSFSSNLLSPRLPIQPLSSGYTSSSSSSSHHHHQQQQQQTPLIPCDECILWNLPCDSFKPRCSECRHRNVSCKTSAHNLHHLQNPNNNQPFDLYSAAAACPPPPHPYYFQQEEHFLSSSIYHEQQLQQQQEEYDFYHPSNNNNAATKSLSSSSSSKASSSTSSLLDPLEPTDPFASKQSLLLQQQSYSTSTLCSSSNSSLSKDSTEFKPLEPRTTTNHFDNTDNDDDIVDPSTWVETPCCDACSIEGLTWCDQTREACLYHNPDSVAGWDFPAASPSRKPQPVVTVAVWRKKERRSRSMNRRRRRRRRWMMLMLGLVFWTDRVLLLRPEQQLVEIECIDESKEEHREMIHEQQQHQDLHEGATADVETEMDVDMPPQIPAAHSPSRASPSNSIDCDAMDSLAGVLIDTIEVEESGPALVAEPATSLESTPSSAASSPPPPVEITNKEDFVMESEH
ncbi:hypothetical protein BDR26DRAFT_331998 [Obelidium mucronatum]|nr:hypothetical protein BDR26DRAFT_331998 [Obelidium mucronatum]